MHEQIMVPFVGDGVGVGELTWGQRHIWGAIQALGSPMNMSAIRVLAPGATVAEFVDELRFYVERFQAMRTLIRYEPDGRPVQVVIGGGEIALTIVDLGPDADPARAAAELSTTQECTPFDEEVEFPIWMTLLRQAGRLTHLVTTLSHLATDRPGAFAMYADLCTRDPETGAVATAVRLQPLQLAAAQGRPAARRSSDAALAYWESTLRSIPARRFPDPVDRGGPRFWQVRTRSPATYLAVRVVARRCGVDIAAVLLASYAVALTRVFGTSPAVIQVLVSNRFRPGLADIVSNISQTGLCVVDVRDVEFDEAVARTWRAAIAAYKNAYFDLSRWRELLDRVAHDRPGGQDLGYYFNDRPVHADLGRVPTADEVVRAGEAGGPPQWTELVHFNEKLMLTIDDAPDPDAPHSDGAAALDLIVSGDTHYVSRDDLGALLAEVERVAVTAALAPVRTR